MSTIDIGKTDFEFLKYICENKAIPNFNNFKITNKELIDKLEKENLIREAYNPLVILGYELTQDGLRSYEKYIKEEKIVTLTEDSNKIAKEANDFSQQANQISKEANEISKGAKNISKLAIGVSIASAVIAIIDLIINMCF